MASVPSRRLAALPLAMIAGVLFVVALDSHTPGCTGEDRRMLFGLAAASTAALAIFVLTGPRKRSWLYAAGAFAIVFIPIWVTSLNLCAR
jgi:hypothetical protein